MNVSVIFPYRDRLQHLKTSLPRIHNVLTSQGHHCEIIVVEQKDNRKFRRANLLNEGARVAGGNWIIIHDVDYYPVSDATEYVRDGVDLFLPVRRVEFVRNDLTSRPKSDVPGGYRHFNISVDADFFGGISAFTRDAFYAINGFSSKFVGWGFEDADLRERVQHYNLKFARSDDNLFYALDHDDSGPPPNDTDFHRNVHLWHVWRDNLTHGLSDFASHVQEISCPLDLGISNFRWLEATGFDPVIPPVSPIVASKFNFDEGDEA